jgi:hypothetical protein
MRKAFATITVAILVCLIALDAASAGGSPTAEDCASVPCAPSVAGGDKKAAFEACWTAALAKFASGTTCVKLGDVPTPGGKKCVAAAANTADTEANASTFTQPNATATCKDDKIEVTVRSAVLAAKNGFAWISISNAGDTGPPQFLSVKGTTATIPTKPNEPAVAADGAADGQAAEPAASKPTSDGGLTPADIAPRVCGVDEEPEIDWSLVPDHACEDVAPTGRRRKDMAGYSQACTIADAGAIHFAPDRCTAAEPKAEKNEKLVVIDENLSIRRGSDAFITETDRLVVRFLVRRALACRVFAFSDSANKYDPQTFRVGGADGLATVKLPKSGLVEGARDNKVYSCDQELVPLSKSQSPSASSYTTLDNAYVAMDFRFGPFTSDNVVIHLVRRDRTLSGKDLEQVFSIPNHLRYSGWFDITVGGNYLSAPSRDISAVAENGSSLRRLRASEKQLDLDIAVMLKAFAICSDGTYLFNPADLREANACLGVGTGLSIAHPLKTFYPIGVNLTLGRFFSFHYTLSLNLADTFAHGYAEGDLYSGPDNDIPKRTRLLAGMGFSVGLDPTLFGTLLKAVVTGR